MKKKALSILISLCMLLALFPVMGTTASAGGVEFTYSSGNTYTSGSVFEISSPATLILLSDAVAAGNTMEGVTFQLTGNLDLNSGFTFSSTSNYTGDDTPNTWTPIGDETTAFSGTFDGKNHTISGLYTSSGSDYTGLFGYVGEKGTVEDLAIANSCFHASGSDSDYVGGVAGNNDGTITNCSNAAYIYGYQYIGGIAGYSIGTVTNCSNSADITGSYWNIGGIVGYCQYSTISNNYNTGNISGSERLGGIAGYCSQSTIYNNYNTGNISGSQRLGGIAGYCSQSTIYNNYNAGNVSGTTFHKSTIRSLVGYCTQSAIRYCYWLKTDDICKDLDAVGSKYCVGCGYVTSADGCINRVTYNDNTVVTGDKVTLVEALNAWVKEYENLSDYDTWTVTSGVNGGLPTLGTAWESTLKTVDVKYYNGDDLLKSQTVTVDRSSLSNYEPTAENSDFLGWAISRNSDTVTYLPLDTYTSDDYANDSYPNVLSLYAVWDTAAGAENHYTATVYNSSNIDINSDTDGPSGKVNVGDSFEFGDTEGEIAVLPGASAQLTVYAKDVDAPYEIDAVYLVDVTDESNPITWTIGKLSGLNNKWNTTVLSVPQSLFKSGHTYQLQISASDGWKVSIHSVYLLLDGGDDAANILYKSVSVSVDTDGHPSAITSLTTESASTYTLEYKLSSVDENGDTVQLGGNGNGTHKIETTASNLTGTDTIEWSDLTLESGTTYQLDVTINNGAGIPVSTITKTFTVHDYSYDLNGHGSTAPDGGIVMAGEKLTKPSDPVATGYAFGGWYEENSCINKWNFNTYVVNADTTLYALWTLEHEDSYPVTLNLNGGTVNSGNMNSYDYGVGATLPTDVTKDGAVFGGWYAASDFSGDAVTAISSTALGAKSYYAKWVQNPTIGTQPASQAVAEGNSASFTVAASADTGTLSYQWQKKGSGGAWSNISGATDATYSISGVTASKAGEYRCVVTASSDGTTATTTSDAATLTVTYSVTVTINKNSSASSDPVAGDVELRQDGDTKATLAGSSGVYTANAANGTYDVYVNNEDTGANLTISDAANSVTVDYYTVSFSATYAGTASSGRVTATAGGVNIESGASVLAGKEIVLSAAGEGTNYYSYFWSGTGANGQDTNEITVSSLSGNVDAICAVTGRITAPTYSVSLSTNGGSIGSGSITSYTFGVGVTLPTNVTRTDSVFIGWYADSDFSGSPVTAIGTDESGAKTFYAKWNYGIGGTVTDGNGPIAGVTVTIRGNNIEQQTTYTDPTGNYSFSDIPPGEYNIVAVTRPPEDVTKTIIRCVTDADVTDANIQMPAAGTEDSIVTIAEDTPDVVVGYLDQQFSSNDDTYVGNDSSNTVKIELNVEKKSENVATGAESIQELAGSRTVDMYLDMELTKTVTGTDASTEPLFETASLLKIVIPYDLTGKPDIAVYRYHNSAAEAMTEAEYSSDTPIDECYMVNTSGNQVIIWTKSFSTYAISYLNTYTVSYDGNGETSGSVPASSIVTDGTTWSSPGNTGSLAKTGYTFQGWALTDCATSAVSTDTITSDTVFYAVWSLNSSSSSSIHYYTITVTAGKGGSISPSGTVSIVKGTDKTFTFTPDDGYAISDVLIDGKSVGAVSSYTFTNMDSAHTISVVFVKAEGLPYYLDGGNKVFIGFASDASGKMNYIAPEGETVLFIPNPKNFTDISGHWAKSYIDFVTQREIFVGTDTNTFSPDTGMTRAMFATVIGRLYERSYGPLKTTGQHSFTDCDYGQWYGDYIDWCSENGIIEGVGGGLFEPDREITREEMAAILYRFANFMDVNSVDSKNAQLGYPDASSISSWAANAAEYCRSTGIIQGRDGGCFAPKDTATRAEVSVILKRFIEMVIDQKR